jgi:hypothetical protein
VRRAGCAFVLLSAALAANAQAPHAHGVGKLDVALDGRRLTLELAAPLEDVLGFERKPANDKERAALEAASAYLKSGQGFVASLAANCRLSEGAAGLEERGPGHLELTARLAYDCKEPHALDSIEAALLARYKRMKRLDVRIVGPKGQSTARVTAAKPSFPL